MSFRSERGNSEKLLMIVLIAFISVAAYFVYKGGRTGSATEAVHAPTRPAESKPPKTENSAAIPSLSANASSPAGGNPSFNEKPATNAAANASAPAPVSLPSRPPSNAGQQFQPIPSTDEVRQACHSKLGGRMEAAKLGNYDPDAEVCVVLDQREDDGYEALVDRSVALQNEICPKVYPRPLDSAEVMADPVLGPKARELQELQKQFMQRMNDNNNEIGKLVSKDPQDQDTASVYRYKLLEDRILIDIGRVAGNCTDQHF